MEDSLHAACAKYLSVLNFFDVPQDLWPLRIGTTLYSSLSSYFRQSTRVLISVFNLRLFASQY